MATALTDRIHGWALAHRVGGMLTGSYEDLQRLVDAILSDVRESGPDRRPDDLGRVALGDGDDPDCGGLATRLEARGGDRVPRGRQ